MKRKKKIIIPISLLSLFLFVNDVFSSTQVDWPTSPLTGIRLNENSEFHDFIAYLYGWGIGFGAILTFVILLVAGIEYMTSVGNSTKMQNAKNRIQSAAIGIVFLLSSWLILHTINPQLTSVSPLPDFWDELSLSGENLILEKGLSSPPCAMAVLYSSEFFAGGGEQTSPGKRDVSGKELPYNSGKGFASLTEEEKELLASGDDSFAEGREIIGDYIEYPGACLVTVYYSTGFFVRRERQMGVFTLPNANFSEALWEEKEPSSFEIRSTNVSEN